MALNPNVPYEGYILPRDAGKLTDPERPSPNINYNGAQLPRDAAKLAAFKDFLNKPGEIKLNNGVQEIVMPPDTVIIPDAEKLLVKTNILDGVSAFERILRFASFMELRGTVRMQDIDGTRYNNTTPPAGLTGNINNVFPQEYINDIWEYVFLPNTVLVLKNSFLNGIGIQQVIVEKMSYMPGQGTTNVGYRLGVWENVNGPSLIIGS